jgi:hypothetical protein
MPELPSSWGLKTRKREDGKLDIVGKDDLGSEYKVRTTDTAEITERDIVELKDADRESYADKDKGAREFCSKIMNHGKQREAAREEAFMDELMEASGPVVHAGLERKGLTVGSTSAYRRGWEQAFGNERGN